MRPSSLWPIAAALANPVVRPAPEIKIFTARAIATVLAEIGGEFERATGYKLIVVSDLPAGFQRRINAGEHFDLLISGPVPVDEWIRDGRLVATTRTDIARSGIGVEVSPDTIGPSAARAADGPRKGFNPPCSRFSHNLLILALHADDGRHERARPSRRRGRSHA
jgi:Bacterial extracellular solute-binding protein